MIMTRQERAQRYEKLVCGKELLESWYAETGVVSADRADLNSLHLNLIDHLVMIFSFARTREADLAPER